jgi:hypothetical protein
VAIYQHLQVIAMAEDSANAAACNNSGSGAGRGTRTVHHAGRGSGRDGRGRGHNNGRGMRLPLLDPVLLLFVFSSGMSRLLDRQMCVQLSLSLLNS